uniref:Uncharacterized protein n=1 Tax=viral metagenome TaxID=1070528 RepID=A0A6C0KJR4_9ZZZZ
MYGKPTTTNNSGDKIENKNVFFICNNLEQYTIYEYERR